MKRYLILTSIVIATAILAYATSTVDIDVKCANCGETSTQKAIASTSTYGSGDLDTRPPPTLRWNISIHMERCPSCGYCSMDVSTVSTIASACVRSKRYREQLNSEEFPELANSYLCLSLIRERAEMFSEAGWACVKAAWACDGCKLRGPCNEMPETCSGIATDRKKKRSEIRTGTWLRGGGAR